MDNHILTILKEARESNQIVSIHSNPANQAVCTTGVVDYITDSMVRLKLISPGGEPDGYKVRLLKNVFRIDVYSEYEKKIAFLNKNYNEILNEVKLVDPIENNNLIYSTLKESKQKKLIIVIWTDDEEDSIIGYIDDLNVETVKIVSINDYGQEDGIIILKIDEIREIDCNSYKCQILKYLNIKYSQ